MLKRTIAITLCALLFLVACGGNQQPQPEHEEPYYENNAGYEYGEQDSENQTPSQEENGQETAQPREVVYFENFPGVENIIHFLELDEEDITVFYETDTRFIFGFVDPPVCEITGHRLMWDYVNSKSYAGFEVRVFDATISSTVVLENDEYIINIMFLIVEEWKEAFRDTVSLANKITDENVIFDVRFVEGASSEETLFELQF